MVHGRYIMLQSKKYLIIQVWRDSYSMINEMFFIKNKNNNISLL